MLYDFSVRTVVYGATHPQIAWPENGPRGHSNIMSDVRPSTWGHEFMVPMLGDVELRSGPFMKQRTPSRP